ncbi:MAG: hypothetical protein HYY24_19785 [Verrucomicrobia bacterium]|nr:hypothetical protein [Verrucomicrobiota bacterium]
MKVIELEATQPSLEELLKLAGKTNVVLKSPEGREFMLAEVDEFAREVELLRRSKSFRAFLAKRSAEPANISLAEVKRRLGIRS